MTPSSEPSIRAGVAADAGALGDLYLELQGHHARLQPDSPRYRLAEARWRQVAGEVLAKDDHEVLIAEDERSVLGCAVLRYDQKPWGLACQIETLVVTADRRGEGIGGALIESCEEAGARRGALAMRVEVIVENDEGRAFYERRGYQALALRYGKPLASRGRKGG